MPKAGWRDKIDRDGEARDAGNDEDWGRTRWIQKQNFGRVRVVKQA